MRVTGPPREAPPAKEALLEDEQESTRAMPAPQLKEALRQSRSESGRARGLRPAQKEVPGPARKKAAARGSRSAKRKGPPPAPEAAVDPKAAQADDPGEVAWYAVISGKQEGPMDLAALRAALVAGRISRRTYVWSEAIDDWRPISSVTRLRPLLDELAPPSPPAGPNRAAGTLQMKVEDIALAEAKGRARKATQAQSTEASLASALVQAAEDVHDSDGDGHLDQGQGRAGNESPDGEVEDPLEGGDALVDPFSQALAEDVSDDPFSSVPDASDTDDPDAPPRETTQMFILASGVNKRKSPLRIAGAILGFAAFIGGMAYLLTVTGVDLKGFIPRVKEGGSQAGHESGPIDEERVRLIREKLLGSGKAPPVEETTLLPIRVGRGGKGGAIDRVGDQPEVEKEKRVVTELDAADRAAVAALYGEKRRHDVKIRVKVAARGEGVDSVESPIDPSVVARKITETQKAFQNCVQQELRRNPGFKGGRVLLTLTVLPSGIVKSAAIDPRDIHLSDVGVCIRRSIKRVVFPSFGGDGPVDFEVPLLLSTGY